MAGKPKSMGESLEQRAQQYAGDVLSPPEHQQDEEAAKREKPACGLLHPRAKQAFRFEMPPMTDEQSGG